MVKGIFISLEGGEGCGKTTQADLLGQWLESHQIPYIRTREPGGSQGGEAIRQLLLQRDVAIGDRVQWNMRAEALLFAAARSDHVETLIRPALAAGKWVICDRFIDSSRAYQGEAGGLGDRAICDLHQFGSAGFMPDVTLYLQISAKIAADRLGLRDGDASDHIGGRNADYHHMVRQFFDRLAKDEPERLRTIQGGADHSAVHREIIAIIAPLAQSWQEARQ